ncbi:MAG: OmpA family protein [Hydrogenophilaceae bacterium]
MRTPLFTLLSTTLFAAGIVSAQAADAPYYNPENAASPSKFTTGYELFRTIGCPGKQLLDPACKAPVAVAAPAPAPMKAAPLDGDHDGVTDDKDKCPTTPAGRKVNAQGCELDGDNDGVVDALDRCPTTPAGRKVDAKGCELDGDNDGVVDALDQCPTTPAGDKVDSKGCTLLNTIVLKGVNFDNDSAKLRTDSYPILDEAVATMKRYPGMKVEVAGHTDSNSSDAHNLKLSANRAKAVMDYFVSKGVPAEDLTSKGYGESTPIADNKTAEGRAENRRVELHIQ